MSRNKTVHGMLSQLLRAGFTINFLAGPRIMISDADGVVIDIEQEPGDYNLRHLLDMAMDGVPL